MNSYQNLIENHYRVRTAKRSGLPLINHINEGVGVLEHMGCHESTINAFRIHPLVQRDEDLVAFLNNRPLWVDPYVLMLAMEYRSRANAWLSDKVTYNKSTGEYTFDGEPNAGPLKEVAEMLYADKLQNHKDFKLYHLDTHPRARELLQYFRTWINYLTKIVL